MYSRTCVLTNRFIDDVATGAPTPRRRLRVGEVCGCCLGWPEPTPGTAVTATTRSFRTIDYTVTEASLDVARRNLYKELREFCELGVISVGADGVISAAAPPAEIAHYDDGKMQTLIDSQVSIDDLF
eukprot:SAG31_NODE_1134_length_9737_cov_13.245798_7_plen_127_part_00